MASELVASRSAGGSSGASHEGYTLNRRDTRNRDGALRRDNTASNRDDTASNRDDTLDPRDEGCVVCGMPAPEVGACCSSRCAGEAQRQLRRNAAHLRRLERRDAHELRHRLCERNGRLMSALLRWRPDARHASTS